MRQIESSQNKKIKTLRRIIERRVSDLWVFEGIKLISEAFEAQVQIEEVYITADFVERKQRLIAGIEAKGIPVFQVSAALMKKISTVDAPPGILAIAKRMPQKVQVLAQRFGALLVSVRDPGNFGAILRVAEAVGCSYVAYTSDCVDPYSPKTVRASTGSILRMPILEVSDVAKFLAEQESQNISIYALDAHRGVNIFQEKPSTPAILVIGSESHGLPPEISIPRRVRIPMEGRVESLNAAVAAGICFYWFANSRSKHE